MRFLFIVLWGLWPLDAAETMAQPLRPVEFIGEHITMQVSQDTVAIHGIYTFRNRTSVSQRCRVVFPFHVDEFSEYPNDMRAFVVEGADTLGIDLYPALASNSARLAVPVRANAEVAWHLLYRQRINSAYARYILTSTREWGRSLDTATYRFVVPAHYEETITWPPATLVGIHDGWRVLECTREDFLPERDMVVMWYVPAQEK